MSAPSSCGCPSCDGGGVEYAPVEYAPAPVEYVPAPSSGCSACDSASASEPRGFMVKRSAKRSARKSGLAKNKGMGLLLKGKGKACEEVRSLRPSAAGVTYSSDAGVISGGSYDSCDSCSGGVEQTAAEIPGGFLFGNSNKGRRISSGIVSDIREARGGCGVGGCGIGGGGTGGGGKLAARKAAGIGCGHRGCGSGGKLCASCSKLAFAAGLGHPYGGGIPHTNPAAGQQPQSGIAPQYAYPYYTTRGPRDFLRDNPPTIGN